MRGHVWIFINRRVERKDAGLFRWAWKCDCCDISIDVLRYFGYDVHGSDVRLIYPTWMDLQKTDVDEDCDIEIARRILES